MVLGKVPRYCFATGRASQKTNWLAWTSDPMANQLRVILLNCNLGLSVGSFRFFAPAVDVLQNQGMCFALIDLD